MKNRNKARVRTRQPEWCVSCLQQLKVVEKVLCNDCLALILDDEPCVISRTPNPLSALSATAEQGSG